MIPMNAYNIANKKQNTKLNIKHDYHFAILTNMSIHTHRHSHSYLNGKHFWKEMLKKKIDFFFFFGLSDGIDTDFSLYNSIFYIFTNNYIKSLYLSFYKEKPGYKSCQCSKISRCLSIVYILIPY